MSASTSLQARVERYLVERRRLGFSLRTPAYSLRSFVRYLQAVGHCEFACLDAGMARIPDETTILRFRRLLEEHNLSIQLLATINATLIAKGLMLKTGTVVDATTDCSAQLDQEPHR